MAAGTAPRRADASGAARLPDTARRRIATERLASVAIRAGGLAVILAITGIFAFLVVEILPVLLPARVALAHDAALAGVVPRALLLDEYRTHDAALGRDGVVRVVRLEDGAVRAEQALADDFVAVAGDAEHSVLAGVARDGRIAAAPVAFTASFEEQRRVVTPSIGAPIELALFDDAAAAPAVAGPLAVRAGGDAQAGAAALAGGGVALVQRRSERNAFTGETTESLERRVLATPAPVTALALDPKQEQLYAGTADGRLLRFDLRAGVAEPESVDAGGAAISALSLLIGGRTLVVGQADGALSSWFTVPQENGPARLTRTRDYPSYPGAVRAIAPSQRDRAFLVAADDGTLGFQYSTSGRTLWRGDSPLGPATALALAPKGDGGAIAAEGRLASLDVRASHPELSLGSLFGKVWYEGAPRPEYVWQSSSGDDAFEPKLSLVPLVVGTLKGTFYALLLAVPLGVLGAMYTSQFMHARLQRWVKPGVEIMAALPSVVLGFLAALWLAPRVERLFSAFLAMGVAIPVAAIAGGWLWSRLPKRWVARVPDGTEVLWIGVAIAAAMALCVSLSAPLERALFGGSFPAWLETSTGLPFDQRNAVVVGIAMGFAVIPIIFAISEDAFSNVPADLSAGSLALGANRWQTVVRVVLPTASPGIFSAIMVGFGRAVGETMIVLMATGNTPILDWSPFNGFRTLSANIAVEIPEAPHGGTLYRTLFLAALLLFAMTFAVNTAAELVRHRLRRRYGRL
ncbi:MAG: ABC transporter permease [Proteobacteria bacterium]|nr:MAG: ABC transporter permease [Pseudomonadota bacterium]